MQLVSCHGGRFFGNSAFHREGQVLAKGSSTPACSIPCSKLKPEKLGGFGIRGGRGCRENRELEAHGMARRNRIFTVEIGFSPSAMVSLVLDASGSDRARSRKFKPSTRHGPCGARQRPGLRNQTVVPRGQDRSGARALGARARAAGLGSLGRGVTPGSSVAPEGSRVLGLRGLGCPCTTGAPRVVDPFIRLGKGQFRKW